MSIQDCVHDALNTLRDIATDETVDVELRISAAEKILDYAARLGEYQDDKTDAIGFTVGDHAEQDFGEYLRKLRKENGLTIRQLAYASSVSQTYIVNIENGKRGIPSPEIIKRLAGPLRTPFTQLMKNAGYVPSDAR